MTDHVMGIDGGGTKTRGVISTLEGKILGYTVVASTNYHAVGLDAVEKELKQIIDQLAGDERRGKVSYFCIGLSGVGRPVDYERIGSVLQRLGIEERTFLTNDAVTALIGGALAEKGILIIAGTGSIVYGMDGKGNMARAGGFGQYLADEGSGYRIGLKGLVAIMKSFDGRIPPVSITEPVLNFLKLKNPTELVTWIGGLSNVKEEVGKIAPFVLQAAEEGDQTCLAIVDEEISELVLAVKAVVNKLKIGEDDGSVDVVMVGGVLENNEYYFERLAEGIKASLPRCNPIKPKAPAVVGAVIAAMKKINVEPDQGVIRNLLEGIKKFT